MLHPSIPFPIAQRVLIPLGAVRVDSVAAGMSGAMVFRCRLASGEFRALRCWPEETALSRVLEITRVAIRARENGCDLVPRPYSCTGNPGAAGSVEVHRGRIWQLSEWMPGEPLRVDCDLRSIERGGAAICRFHSSISAFHDGGCSDGNTLKSVPAIQDRLDRVQWLTPRLFRILERFEAGVADLPSPLDAALHEARQLVSWKWNEVAARITRSLSKDAQRHWSGQYVIRDIHRENALFEAGEASGLVDLDAVRIDTPWIDLARWAGSFLGNCHENQAVWDAATAGFCGKHTLNNSPEMEFGPELAANLCYATTWIALANWLVWIVGDRRQFGASSERIAARIRELHLVAAQGV